jgi:protein tyrosine phosphatase (PTP) superfamily phosphohydrolase (DUF442 family)
VAASWERHRQTSGVADAPSAEAPRIVSEPFAAVGDAKHLHNAHRVTPKVLSGAQPEGEESFKVLRDLGVKTIVTVDGATPDVATAKKYGMRYVHLPIGYDGVPREQGMAIAKALDELPGPIYLHCHHGKHRSAAAVAVACVYNGSLKPEQAASVLRTFGTGENYKGLWNDARAARPVDPEELNRLNVEYVEVAKIEDLALRMVAIDGLWDHMKLIRKAGWKPLPEHPDLDPPHEALQLREHFHEAARLPGADARPQAFRTTLADSEAGLESLRAALAADPVDATAATAAFDRVAASCTSCHKAYRD